MVTFSKYEIIVKLQEFTSRMTRVTTLQELANVVEETLDEFIPTEHTGLYLWHPREKKLKLLFAKGFSEEEKRAAEESAMERHPGIVFTKKIDFHVPDVEADKDQISAESPRSFKVRSRLYLPVMDKDKCIGAFGVTSSQPNRFSEEDIEMLRFICQLAGVIYSNMILEVDRKQVLKDLELKDRAINSSSNGIIITDATLPDNPLIFANPAFYKITGYSPDDVLGKNCRFLQGTDRDQEALKILRDSIKNKTSCTIKLRNYRKDGTLFWNELMISPIFNGEGLVTNYVGIQNDISDRVLAEEMILESRTRLSELIQNMGSGVLVEDENRRIVITNNEFCKIFNIPVKADNLIGADCSNAAEQSKNMLKEPEEFVTRIDIILREKEIVKSEELEFLDGRIFERDYVPIFINHEYRGHLWNYRDITHRKNNEKQIRNLALFPLENPNPILRVSFSGELLYANPASKKLLNQTGIEIGEKIPDRFFNLIKEAIEKQSSQYFEDQIGDEYYSFTYAPVMDSGYLNVFVMDITQKKIAEKQLNELKAFYEQTLNDLPGQIAVFDENYKYLYVNPSSISNKETREWIIGKDDYEFCQYKKFDYSVAVKRREWLEKAKKEKVQIKFDEILKKDENDIYYFERIISPVFNENGEVKQLLAYGVDVTLRKKTEIELLSIKNQLEAVLNTVGEGIITVNDKGIVVLVNDEIEKIWGWRREEIIGKDLRFLMPESYREAHQAGIERYRMSKNSKVLGKLLTMEGLKKDGTIFPLQIRIKETMIGEQTLFTAAILDITELNRLIKDLETSNKSLSEFAYIASHDLREPLRKISSFGSILQKTLKNKLDEDDKENFDFMIDGAKRMQQMVDDLLVYSRLTTQEKKIIEVNLDELFEEIVNFDLAEMIAENNASIVKEGELGKIHIDPTHIRQLVQNLIGNGIKYHKKDIPPVVKIKSVFTSHNFNISVEDNGIGIDKNYQEQIFEMFKRLHGRGEYSGSGIGLSVCKKITELYAGEIGVDSEPGVGSTFKINLPFK